jgi:multiple sugar transport system ATP-binding protein
MGRAIVRDPQVFLFDEPLSNLDAKLRVQMRAEIKDLHQRLKTTTVYVTHDQIEAMTMADKIVVMNSGNVEQIGAPLELYDRPANLFVAGFIGSPAMNFVRGRIEGGMVRSGHVSLPLPPGLADGEGRAVIYGVRPEHWRLDPNGVKVTVKVVEPTGSETQVIVSLGDADVPGDAKMVCAFRERVSARPGETLAIAPDTAVTHLFDEASGGRLN